MYVTMLSERTNLLLDEERKRLLEEIAKREKTSIGELIRRAIDRMYRKSGEEEIKRRTKVVNKIKALRKKMKPLKGITIRELIDYGRYR